MTSTVSPRVPAHRHGITPEWLTSALRSTEVISLATWVSACVQHPVVAVTVSGEAREDGGGISGPQIIRLALAYDGNPGPAQIIAKCGNWQDKHQMPAWPLKSRLIQVLGHMSTFAAKSRSSSISGRTSAVCCSPRSIMPP